MCGCWKRYAAFIPVSSILYYVLVTDDTQKDQVSLSAESLALPSPTGEAKRTWADVPMRAFAAGFYSNLIRLYNHLGVRYHEQPFLFSFSRLAPSSFRGPADPYMVHTSNFHQVPPAPRNRGLVPWLIEGIYVLACYLWFTVCCFFVPPLDMPPGETLDHYLRRIHLPRSYADNYLLPLISSVCTCDHHQLLRFPASDILDYKKRTHRQGHYVVTDGVHAAQEQLLRGLDVRLGVHSTRVSPTQSGVEITIRNADGGESTERFDRAVLAMSPDIVASIFAPLQSALTAIPTTTVDTVAHTDYSALAPMLRATTKPPGASVGTPASSQRIQFVSSGPTTESVHEQPNSLLVTTNPLSPVDRSKVIRSATFTRVLRTPQSRALVNELFGENESEKSSSEWRNGDHGVYLAGGWCWDGMVLLEGCVVSAMRVAADLGVEIPW